jgi:hypothetical protein
LRTKPEELPEITHNCYMEWDDIMMALKEYCRQYFQDMESIIQDLMLITEKPGYVRYEEPILDAADLRGLDAVSDPLGIHKQTLAVSISRLVSSGAANKIEIAAADNYLSSRDY